MASFEQTAVNAVTQGWATGGGAWYSTAIVAVFTSIFLVAFGYMISVVLDLPDLKKWARAEFLQAMASAMLVFGLIAFTGIVSDKVSNITLALAQQNPVLQALPPGYQVDVSNPFGLSEFYLTSMVRCMKSIYVNSFWIDAMIEPLESVTISTGGFHSMSGWPLGYITNMFHNINKTLTWLLIANYFQLSLLDFVQKTMLQLFLPLGVVLRVLPYTRGAGAFLMGIAIGSYFIYPFSYALIVSVASTQDMLQCVEFNAADIKEACASEQGISRLSYLWKSTGGAVLEFMDKSNALVSFMMMEAFIYPLIALTITFTAIKQLSDMFGANVAEIGAGLVKLI